MTEIQTEVTKLSLAESKVQDIKRRLAVDLNPAITAVEEEIAESERVQANWRDMPDGIANAERIAQDCLRLKNRLAILIDMRKRAEADLRVEQAQVDVDRLSELRAELQRIGDQRTQRARDIVSTVQMLAGLINEDVLQREQMSSIANQARGFFLGRADGDEEIRRSKTYSEFLRTFDGKDWRGERDNFFQTFVEHVLGTKVPSHAWAYEHRNSTAATVPDPVLKVSGQCKGGLGSLDECMRRLVEDAKASVI